MNPASIIQATRFWLEHTVIGFNFCPFAKREFVRKSIRYWVASAKRLEPALEELMAAVTELEQDPAIETTLLILPQGFERFDDYLDLLELANQLLSAQGFDGIYQLASFHPDYCFDGQPESDPANYTNRSPYPMLHLLREASIETALQFVEDPEAIPQRNVELARSLGSQVFAAILQRSLQPQDPEP